MSADNDRNRPAVETVYLELSDAQSHKFYEVTVNGTAVTVRYGRIGTAGQSSNNTYATPEKAQAEATKKINEKLRKGYTRISSGDGRSTSSAQLPDPAGSAITSGISSRFINLVDLTVERLGGRSALKFPLQRSLVAVELTATCNQPTFTINLCIGSDIAYHFDVRSQQGQILQNTCITRKWGTEERLSIPTEFTFDQPFTLRIAVEETVVVYLNEQVLSRYAHRLPAPQMDVIEISYPSGNLQVQSVQVFERMDAAIEIPIASPAVSSTQKSPPNQQPVSSQGAASAPPAIDSLRLPSSIELMNQFNRGAYPPRGAIDQLGANYYPLGFALNLEEPRYCNLNIPLPRSLACLEIVGTFKDLATSAFKVRLEAWRESKRELGYWFEFSPHRGGMVQWSAVAGNRSRDELIRIPSEIKSGEQFQFVLTFTAEGNIVFYLNNQPFHHNFSRRPDQPINFLHVSYDLSGQIEVQLIRVLELEGAKAEPAPLPSQSDPRPSPKVVRLTGTPPKPSELPQWLRDLPSQFEPLRPVLEANLQPYIKIHSREEVQWRNSVWDEDPLEPWQSKIGGFPYLPKGTIYPSDRETGEMMMFLMQINCADLPIINGFALPQQGILQFYSGLCVPEDRLSPEKHRILYFPKISQDRDNLITDFSFLAEFAYTRDWYEEIYSSTFSAQQDVFRVDRGGYVNTFDVPQELKKLCDEFHRWLGEQGAPDVIDRRGNKLGGEVEAHSYVDETVGDAKGQLLLELNHPDECCDYFYFFIEDSDLANLDFSKVESYFMRT